MKKTYEEKSEERLQKTTDCPVDASDVTTLSSFNRATIDILIFHLRHLSPPESVSANMASQTPSTQDHLVDAPAPIHSLFREPSPTPHQLTRLRHHNL